MIRKDTLQEQKTALPVTVTAYIAHLKRAGRAETTIISMIHYLGVLNGWLHKNSIAITDAKHADLQAFQQYLFAEYPRKLSNGTISNYFHAIRDFYRFLVRDRSILSSPAELLLLPKSTKPVHRDILDRDELLSLIRAPGTNTATGLRDTLILRLMALSGLRRGDIIGLHAEDINLSQREIIIRNGKGKRDRLCFFDRGTQKLMAQYFLQTGVTGLLFLRENGEPLNGDTVAWVVERAVKTAKIKYHLTPHSLRRTFCNLLLRSGCGIKVIAELAGHKRLSTTVKYTKVDIRLLSEIYRQSHPRSHLHA